ncbi:MAG: hypothetical protein P1U65_14420 [Minwuia sp.]|nr:hypothetical protein [Minwuia sp.]
MTSDADISDAQTAGLLLAVAALMGSLRARGALTEAEVDAALGGIAGDIRGSKLAAAVPLDPMIAATLAPIERLQHMNALFDPASGTFPDWIARADPGEGDAT